LTENGALTGTRMRIRLEYVAIAMALLIVAGPQAVLASDKPSAPRSLLFLAQAEGPMVITPGNRQQTYPGSDPYAPPSTYPPHPTYPQQQQAAPPYSGARDPGGPGIPYEPAPHQRPLGEQSEEYLPPEAQDDGTFSMEEIKDTGHRFFGKVSMGLARVIEYAFQRAGRPNGYILGEEAGGAFIAGLRYGEGVLYTKDAGEHRVFWQGPSLGYDFGAEGSKTMVLVYKLQSPGEIYQTFGGVDGSAYFIGGVGITFLTSRHVTLAPIRSGVGLRLGANVGYLKYTRQPTWNPF
jgi:hypothetical protein